MKKTSNEISNRLIELSDERIELEKERLELVHEKKKLVAQVMKVDGKLQRVNSDLSIRKKEAQGLGQQSKILSNTFDQRDAERLLTRSCLILKGVLSRGIGLEPQEERIIKDIESFINL